MATVSSILRDTSLTAAHSVAFTRAIVAAVGKPLQSSGQGPSLRDGCPEKQSAAHRAFEAKVLKLSREPTSGLSHSL